MRLRSCPRRAVSIPAKLVRKYHRRQWFAGRHHGDPAYLYRFPIPGKNFVLVCIPTSQIDAEAVTPGLVKQYAKILKLRSMGPSFATVKKTPKKPCKPVFVRDGNHRSLAAKRIGRKYVHVIMPRSSYETYRDLDMTGCPR